MKPMLFNTDMVRAILDGHKTVTRQVVKPQPELFGKSYVCKGTICTLDGLKLYAPYKRGDILYVRETFSPLYPDEESQEIVGYMYKAETRAEYDARIPLKYDWYWTGKWKPSIHMPREAARIFLRVTDVRVERLQDIAPEQVKQEGVEGCKLIQASDMRVIHEYLPSQKLFIDVWNSTIKKADLVRYGWDANPWVWVIEFERISREEAIAP